MKKYGISNEFTQPGRKNFPKKEDALPGQAFYAEKS